MIMDTFTHQFIFFMEWAFYVVRIMYYLVIFAFALLSIIFIIIIVLYFTHRKNPRK